MNKYLIHCAVLWTSITAKRTQLRWQSRSKKSYGENKEKWLLWERLITDKIGHWQENEWIKDRFGWTKDLENQTVILEGQKPADVKSKCNVSFTRQTCPDNRFRPDVDNEMEYTIDYMHRVPFCPVALTNTSDFYRIFSLVQ